MPEITKTPSPTRSRESPYFWPVFAVATVIFYLFGLAIPLVGPDESRYAQVAREMFERGDWITPTLGGFNWFEKPALLYWMEIASYHIFGVTEFAARFGSALFGLGTILCLWILGRAVERSVKQIPDDGSQTTDRFANWIAFIAATTLGIVVFSRGASFDIIVTFPITAALVSFFHFDQSGNATPRISKLAALFFFYFFIGVALLAKGLVGIVFPFAIVAFYYLLSWRLPDKTFIVSLFWGTVVAIAVASVWYVPMYLRHGYAFVDEFFIQHHFQRFTSNKYFHPQPFYFFFWVLPLMTIPWLPFLVAAIWDFIKRIVRLRDEETEKDILSPEKKSFSSPLLRLALAWLVVPLVFFSFSGSKLPGYILPALPAAIILTADRVYRFACTPRRRTFLKSIGVATYAVLVVLLISAVPKFAEGDSVRSLIEAANARGFSDAKVLSLHTISHNAEFYASGRLLRDTAGKQRKLLGPSEVQGELRRENGGTVLVLVPLEYLHQLTQSDDLATQIIADNGELAITAVSEK